MQKYLKGQGAYSINDFWSESSQIRHNAPFFVWMAQIYIWRVITNCNDFRPKMTWSKMPKNLNEFAFEYFRIIQISLFAGHEYWSHEHF